MMRQEAAGNSTTAKIGVVEFLVELPDIRDAARIVCGVNAVLAAHGAQFVHEEAGDGIRPGWVAWRIAVSEASGRLVSADGPGRRRPCTAWQLTRTISRSLGVRVRIGTVTCEPFSAGMHRAAENPPADARFAIARFEGCASGLAAVDGRALMLCESNGHAVVMPARGQRRADPLDGASRAWIRNGLVLWRTARAAGITAVQNGRARSWHTWRPPFPGGPDIPAILRERLTASGTDPVLLFRDLEIDEQQRLLFGRAISQRQPNAGMADLLATLRLEEVLDESLEVRGPAGSASVSPAGRWRSLAMRAVMPGREAARREDRMTAAARLRGRVRGVALLASSVVLSGLLPVIGPRLGMPLAYVVSVTTMGWVLIAVHVQILLQPLSTMLDRGLWQWRGGSITVGRNR